MRIEVRTDNGKLIDSYDDVYHTDLARESFTKPILKWLGQTLLNHERRMERLKKLDISIDEMEDDEAICPVCEMNLAAEKAQGYCECGL